MIKPIGFVDYTGFKSGKATVLSFHSWHKQPSGQKKSKWLCSCECGNTFVAMGANLKKEGHTTSCGCEKNLILVRHRAKVKSGEWIPKDLNGQKFGRISVIDFNSWDTTTEQQISTWNCICDCGKEVVKRRINLQDYSSCGCWKSEKISEIQTKHGYHGSPTHTSWVKMRERCHTEYYREKEYYQDAGIVVCAEWRCPETGFLKFLEDMGVRPEGKTLDRIDGTKGYYKENCRWADSTIQAYNRRKSSLNTSGRTGVHLLKDGSFMAVINYYKKRIVLAKGVSFEEACKARESAEIKYYGQVKE